MHACKVTTSGTAVPLDSALGQQQKRDLQQRLEELNHKRGRNRRANPDALGPKRDAQVMPLPDPAASWDAKVMPLRDPAASGDPSPAAQKSAALQQRIQTKQASAANAAGEDICTL